MTRPLHEMLAEARRELATRQRVFPGWIRRGTLDRITADERIRLQAEIVHLLEELAGETLPLGETDGTDPGQAQDPHQPRQHEAAEGGGR